MRAELIITLICIFSLFVSKSSGFSTSFAQVHAHVASNNV